MPQKKNRWLRINNTIFNVSAKVFQEIEKQNLKRGKTRKNTIRLAYLSFLHFKPVEPSGSHYYVRIKNGVKLRVKRNFYEFVVLHNKTKLYWQVTF